MNTIERELHWNNQTENNSSEFVLLPQGDYNFEITEFECGRYDGDDKLPACNMATVQVRIKGPEGIAAISHNLFLHSKTEGMLYAFFKGIGQCTEGGKVIINWEAVVGSFGRCKVSTYNWKGKKYNEIKKFYEPVEKNFYIT